MPTWITRNAKAIVALLLLAVASIGSALGVETGIDVEASVQAVVIPILVALGVWSVPNRPDPTDTHHVPRGDRLDYDGPDSNAKGL